MAHESLRYRPDRPYDVSRKREIPTKISRKVGDNAIFQKSSINTLKPGSIIYCKYDGRERLALVVRTKRTKTGLYTSSRNNKLLTLFLLNSIREDKIDDVINTVYGEKNISHYNILPRNKELKSLNVTFTERFRTFIVSKIQDLMILKIKANKVFKK